VSASRGPGSRWSLRVYDPDQQTAHTVSSAPGEYDAPDGEHCRAHHIPGAEFDELIVGRWLHIEQMDDDTWWMNVGGVTVNVRVRPDGRPSLVDVYGPRDYDAPQAGCRYELTWTNPDTKEN
jgi:hypothetical protein